MKNTALPILCFIFLLSCKKAPQSDHDRLIGMAQESFTKFTGKNLSAANSKIITIDEARDLWSKRDTSLKMSLPCELEFVLIRDKGNIDPSPIAMDVSQAAGMDAGSVIYIPTPDGVRNDCKDARAGWFISPVADCEIRDFSCSGTIGGEGSDRSCAHTCSCHMVCGWASGDCDPCN